MVLLGTYSMWWWWYRVTVASRSSCSPHALGRLRPFSSSATEETVTLTKMTSETSTTTVHPKVQQLVDEIIQLNMIQVKQLTEQLKVGPILSLCVFVSPCLLV